MNSFVGLRVMTAINAGAIQSYWAPDESRFDRYEIVLLRGGNILARIGCLKEGEGPLVEVVERTDGAIVSVQADAGMPGSFTLVCETKAEAIEMANALSSALGITAC